MISITSDLVDQITSLYALALESVKTGNINLLKLLLPTDVVLKQYAKETLDTIKKLEEKERKIRRLMLAEEAVLDCISEFYNFDKIRKDIVLTLNHLISNLVEEHKRENSNLSKEELEEEKVKFKAKLGEEFKYLPWEGFENKKDMNFVRDVLAKDLIRLKSLKEKISQETESQQEALASKRREVIQIRYEIAEAFYIALRQKKINLPGKGAFTERLLKANVPFPSRFSEESHSLVHVAIEYAQFGVFQFLVDCGTDLQAEFESAARQGKINVARTILQAAKEPIKLTRAIICYKDEDGNTLLHHAMRNAIATADYSFVLMLVKQQASMFEYNKRKQTPFSILVFFDLVGKEATEQATKFMWELFKLIFFKQPNVANYFTDYQKTIIETLKDQLRFLYVFLAGPITNKDRKIAQNQKRLAFSIFTLLLLSHGCNDDTQVFDGINEAALCSPDEFYFKEFGNKLKEINLKALKTPGFAFGIVEKQIKDDPNKISVYANQAVKISFFLTIPQNVTTTRPSAASIAVRAQI